MKTSIIGYPRIGADRELKFAEEKYFRREISLDELKAVALDLRNKAFEAQKAQNITFIPSNDFSYYDNMLDTAVLLNAVPERYKALGLDSLDEYFAMARGYQGENGDVKALAMKKWFNTNYHYMVTEIDDSTEIKLAGNKPFELYKQAKENGFETKPVIIGGFTFLKLARYLGEKKAADFADAAADAYIDILNKFNQLGAEYIAFDEPVLVTDLNKQDIELFVNLYKKILANKGNLKIILQTYFGDIRDCYSEVCGLDFDGIGLDFIEGKKTLELVEKNGFPKDKILFAGIVNGKNIWRNNYAQTVALIEKIKANAGEVVLSSSCSLLHVPYTIKSETKLDKSYLKHFAFATEKLEELNQLNRIISEGNSELLEENKKLFAGDRIVKDEKVQARVAALTEKDFVRLPEFAEREKIQREKFNLPVLPTTTIGSFPQTAEVRANRRDFKKGIISQEEYKKFNQQKIAECVKLQEELDFDVLVHGEFERNDMVEYFGECLDGYIFTQKAWVQSYGTRCVKPPVVWGDISRAKPMTVEWSVYAQSLTDRPMKGMLTGPVTILNWSFPREDISLKESAFQIGLAIADEVLDLEKNGIKIIQVDEAALREKLPLRKADWKSDYLDWAIDAFRLVHSHAAPDTQIHTHMCYSEFTDILTYIDDMDADVITFEASRSDLAILDSLGAVNFKTQVGPGVYDIHSPRVPSVEEIVEAIRKMLAKCQQNKLWVNPDCGLKTRGEKETVASLRNLVKAAKQVRKELK